MTGNSAEDQAASASPEARAPHAAPTGALAEASRVSPVVGASDAQAVEYRVPEDAAAVRAKPRWGVLAGVVLLHAAGIAALIQIFAPNLPQQMVDAAVSLVSVDVANPPPVEPPVVPESVHDPALEEGAAAAAGAKAKPRDASVPPVAIPRPNPTPAPPAPSSGTDNRAGAADSGTSQGAGGVGDGLGSGRFGSGQGGMAVTKPEKISGNINSASDFPVPEGGRKIRWGKQVIVSMTVGVDGRASNCRVVDPGPDPQAGPITCRLAEERFRFRPATDARGEPVPSTYGWRQWWEGPK